MTDHLFPDQMEILISLGVEKPGANIPAISHSMLMSGELHLMLLGIDP